MSVEKQVIILSVNLLNSLGVIFLRTMFLDLSLLQCWVIGKIKQHAILADNEFKTLREDIEGEGTRVNITAKEEHVPEIERQNHVIKERVRSIVQMLP